MSLEETLDVIVRKADALRERGVLEVEADGIRLRLAPKDQPQVTATATTNDDDAKPAADPLDDPDTFGGEVPQRRGAPMKEQDDE